MRTYDSDGWRYMRDVRDLMREGDKLNPLFSRLNWERLKEDYYYEQPISRPDSL